MKYLFVLSLFYSGINLYAQSDCNCQKNIEFLDKTIQKLPVTKNTTDFSAYDRILRATQNDSYTGKYSKYVCFQKMSEMLVTLNDRHNMLYSESGFDVETSDTIFHDFPKFQGDLDSLKNKLHANALSEVEGIYTLKHFSVAIYSEGDDLILLNLTSDNPVWKEGEKIGRFLKYEEGRYLAAIGLFHNKQMTNFPVKIKNGRIPKLGFAKQEAEQDFSNVDAEETFYHTTTGEITYLRIGSFSGFNPVLRAAEKFYENLEEKNITKNLILDLRNNGGGGNRNSDILFKYLRKNYKKANIYVLINGRTVSNAEQFALRLRKFKNTILLGSRTSGTIAYELGKTYDFPCYNFTGFFTFKGDKKYMNYESVGIQPDIKLDNSKNWIEQTETYIAKNN